MTYYFRNFISQARDGIGSANAAMRGIVHISKVKPDVICFELNDIGTGWQFHNQHPDTHALHVAMKPNPKLSEKAREIMWRDFIRMATANPKLDYVEICSPDLAENGHPLQLLLMRRGSEAHTRLMQRSIFTPTNILT